MPWQHEVVAAHFGGGLELAVDAAVVIDGFTPFFRLYSAMDEINPCPPQESFRTHAGTGTST